MDKAKWIILWLAVAASAFVIAASASSTRGKVLAIPKTSSYHTYDCIRVNMAKTETMTREEAKNQNLKPCPACNPDK